MRQRLLALSLLLFLVSCDDNELAKVAKSLSLVADVVGQLQTTVIEANAKGLISDADTASMLEIAARVNLAGRSAIAVTREIERLDDPTRRQLLGILGPVIVQVGALVKNGTIGIENPQTKQTVDLIVLSLQSTLNTIQIVLASGE